MPRTRNLVILISIILLFSTFSATAAEAAATQEPVTRTSTQVVADVLTWLDSMIELLQNKIEPKFSSFIEPGG